MPSLSSGAGMRILHGSIDDASEKSVGLLVLKQVKAANTDKAYYRHVIDGTLGRVYWLNAMQQRLNKRSP